MSISEYCIKKSIKINLSYTKEGNPLRLIKIKLFLKFKPLLNLANASALFTNLKSLRPWPIFFNMGEGSK